MARLIPLQAGPFDIDVHWRRQGRFIGLPTIGFFRRERPGGSETLQVELLPTKENLEPPGSEAVTLPNEWSVELLANGASRVLFWCAKTNAYVLEAVFDGQYRNARVSPWRQYRKHQHLNFLLTSATRWMIIHRLAISGGFMMHGAGILRRDAAGRPGGVVVGSGPSGAGKSTLSSFFHGRKTHEVLSDETMIIRKSGDFWEAWGTPWPGMLDVGRNAGGRLERILFLEKTSSNQVQSPSRAEKLTKIWSEVFVPPVDTELTRNALESVEALISAVPVSVLGFRKHPGVVDFVDSLGAAEEAPVSPPSQRSSLPPSGVNHEQRQS